MRKVALLMAIVLVISLPLSVSAAPRTLFVDPVLSFNGTTAICEVLVFGDNTSDYIEVTMKLMYGSSCIASWYDDGYGYVEIAQNATVVKGRTYTLVAEVTVNDVAKTPVSVSKTC